MVLNQSTELTHSTGILHLSRGGGFAYKRTCYLTETTTEHLGGKKFYILISFLSPANLLLFKIQIIFFIQLAKQT